MDEVLKQIGLTPEEAEIYLTLLEKGSLSAQQIAASTSVKRTYVYRICESLIAKGLVKQEKHGRAIHFTPLSPDHLLTIAEEKKQQAQATQKQLENILEILKTKYFTVEERPIIQVYEGIEGLKKAYKDIINEGKDIMLFRSVHDDKRKDTNEIVMNQIKEQIKANIHVRTITPLEEATEETFLNKDAQRLVDRHIINSYKLDLSAQILIYGNKVAIISLKKEIVATILENKDIADSFKRIFDALWNYSESEHNKIISNWVRK